MSGWRGTDSMTLPKMKPTPTPGPTVPRPAPTPRAMARRPLAVASLLPCARRVVTVSRIMSLLLVLLGDRAAEIDRGESAEDEGLQRRHQAHLEEEEGQRHDQRQRPERGEPEQDHQAAGHEQ